VDQKRRYTRDRIKRNGKSHEFLRKFLVKTYFSRKWPKHALRAPIPIVFSPKMTPKPSSDVIVYLNGQKQKWKKKDFMLKTVCLKAPVYTHLYATKFWHFLLFKKIFKTENFSTISEAVKITYRSIWYRWTWFWNQI
jgi:hypothetical protein